MQGFGVISRGMLLCCSQAHHSEEDDEQSLQRVIRDLVCTKAALSPANFNCLVGLAPDESCCLVEDFGSFVAAGTSLLASGSRIRGRSRRLIFQLIPPTGYPQTRSCSVVLHFSSFRLGLRFRSGTQLQASLHIDLPRLRRRGRIYLRNLIKASPSLFFSADIAREKALADNIVQLPPSDPIPFNLPQSLTIWPPTHQNHAATRVSSTKELLRARFLRLVTLRSISNTPRTSQPTTQF